MVLLCESHSHSKLDVAYYLPAPTSALTCMYVHKCILYLEQLKSGGIWSDQVTNQTGGLLSGCQLVRT
jgi:hypothetical protein